MLFNRTLFSFISAHMFRGFIQGWFRNHNSVNAMPNLLLLLLNLYYLNYCQTLTEHFLRASSKHCATKAKHTNFKQKFQHKKFWHENMSQDKNKKSGGSNKPGVNYKRTSDILCCLRRKRSLVEIKTAKFMLLFVIWLQMRTCTSFWAQLVSTVFMQLRPAASGTLWITNCQFPPIT